MDYSAIGLNKYLQPVDSPVTQGSFTPGAVYEIQNEVQAARLNSSKVNLRQLFKRAVGGSALGTFNLSQSLTLTSSIAYNSPKGSIRTFGRTIVGIFQGAGTAAGSQIYPSIGTGVTMGRYTVTGGDLDYSHYNGTADEWRAMIVDTNGTSGQVITFIADWIYADYVTGVAS